MDSSPKFLRLQHYQSLFPYHSAILPASAQLALELLCRNHAIYEKIKNDKKNEDLNEEERKDENNDEKNSNFENNMNNEEKEQSEIDEKNYVDKEEVESENLKKED